MACTDTISDPPTRGAKSETIRAASTAGTGVWTIVERYGSEHAIMKSALANTIQMRSARET
jgi:hypothetical protein